MSKNFSVTVQKYGGSSVSEPQKIKAVASFIRSSLKEEGRICVVVSAMGNTTNDLLGLAKRISNDPPKRELDMLISCGERQSMALLAMALHDLGVSALSLTGSQSGIITDDNHSGAEIIEIKPSRVFEAFLTHQVVIVAGFQGISFKKEITTLRRGGSDTTAVAMAAALNADVCEIYTDVKGVMDVDPKIVAQAQILPVVNFDQMESMALYGAKVVAHDAVRLAQIWGVTLRVLKTGESSDGTTIKKIVDDDNKNMVLAMTHLRGVIRFSKAVKNLKWLLNPEGYFLCGAIKEDNFVGYVSNDLAQELIDGEPSAGFALVTLHLVKNQYAPRVLSMMSSLFDGELIKLEDVMVGRNEIFIVIADEKIHSALAILHKALMKKEIGL